jgi:hypothetical protein
MYSARSYTAGWGGVLAVGQVAGSDAWRWLSRVYDAGRFIL